MSQPSPAPRTLVGAQALELRVACPHVPDERLQFLMVGKKPSRKNRSRSLVGRQPVAEFEPGVARSEIPEDRRELPVGEKILSLRRIMETQRLVLHAQVEPESVTAQHLSTLMASIIASSCHWFSDMGWPSELGVLDLGG